MVDLIKSTAPSAFGAAVAWYEAALSGLKGTTTFAFEGSAIRVDMWLQQLCVSARDLTMFILAPFGPGSGRRWCTDGRSRV